MIELKPGKQNEKLTESLIGRLTTTEDGISELEDALHNTTRQ